MSRINKSEQVLKHLNRYGQIDSWTAIEKFRATRLSSIIFVLKSKGYDIESKWKKTSEGNRFVKYILIRSKK
tara:strand:+ start:234 stop:449 length:216 start_codon:yes stop_codon:yes gene_type:complete